MIKLQLLNLNRLDSLFAKSLEHVRFHPYQLETAVNRISHTRSMAHDLPANCQPNEEPIPQHLR